MKRRSLLLSGLGAAGALVVGWGLLPPRSRLGPAGLLPAVEGEVALNGWIKIAADGSVRLAMNRSEMGQGVHTALATLAAEELDVPLARVALIEPGHDALYGNVAIFDGALWFAPAERAPGAQSAAASGARWVVAKLARELGLQLTGGSSSVADAWLPLRWAAATARARLLGAASLQWRLPVSELAVHAGVVSHPSGPRAHYGELAKLAAAAPPGAVALKERGAWTQIGRALPRTDLAAKTDGRARFGIDTRRPGQVYAVLRQCPVLGGGVGRVDAQAAMRLRGVERVVRLGPYAGSTEGVAVVGRSSWHARRGAEALEIEWRAPPAGVPDTRAILPALEAQARRAAREGGGFVFQAQGRVDEVLRRAPRLIEAAYRAPYLAHAALEPINCTAQVKDGRVTVWAPTQAPGLARAIAAQVAGVPPEAVAVHVTLLGGGFGRRLEVDHVGQAVRVAIETQGRPVQLLWPRDEDLTHDFYRPAAAAVLRAALAEDGSVSALAIASAADAVTPRWLERALPALSGPLELPDPSTAHGLYELPYAIEHRRVAHVATRSGVPVGHWRALGHSHNAFFAESFIDELAHAARRDPVHYRLDMLRGMPRHAAVLRLAAERAGWGAPLPAGRARGVALHESFGSIVAQVAEVSLPGRTPRVHRVVCAADVGTVVNPGLVAQQMEGGILFGLDAALHGRIDIHEGVVQQQDFHQNPLLRLAESPVIETHLVPSTRAPGGAGGPGTPPIAPAVANALFALTGRRLRELPLAL